MLALGVLLAIMYILKRGERAGLDGRIMGDLIFYTLLSALLGAKLLLLLIEFKYYLQHPSALRYLLTSGGTFFGGLFFGILTALWLIRRHRLHFTDFADIIAPALALGHFFGRIGCFLAGCCFGRPAGDCLIHSTFTDFRAHELTGVPLFNPLFPTQLLEALFNLCNFLFLHWWYKRRGFAGQGFAFYVLNYSVFRFFLEYWRGDDVRGFLVGGPDHRWSSLSVSQVIALVGIVTGIAIYSVYKGKSGTQTKL